MDSLLIRRLTAAAEKVTESKTTSSKYFQISNVVIRVSDHLCLTSDGDLTIFHEGKAYMVIPTKVPHKVAQFFTSVNDLMEFINGFIRYHVFYQTTPPIKQDVHIATAVPNLVPLTGDDTKDIESFISFLMVTLNLNSKLRQIRKEALCSYITPRWTKMSQQEILSTLKEALSKDGHIASHLRIKQLCSK
jgi:hypothetical protein